MQGGHKERAQENSRGREERESATESKAVRKTPHQGIAARNEVKVAAMMVL
jgi:hypothetical protein